MKSVDGQAADVGVVTTELNQTQSQTLKDDYYNAMLTICGMPNRNGGSSTSDTGSAVLLRDGWSDAEARAKDSENVFKRAEKKMLKLVLRICRDLGVRFRTAGKIYFFSPGKLEIKTGDKVIVETARGVEFGSVVTGPKEVEDDKITQPLKSVIRLATEDDKKKEEKNKEKEKEAFKICLDKIHKHSLEMKLIDAEYTFDNNKVLF